MKGKPVVGIDRNGKPLHEGDTVNIYFPADWCFESGDLEKHHNAGRLVGTSKIRRSTSGNGLVKFYVTPNDSWYKLEFVSR